MFFFFPIGFGGGGGGFLVIIMLILAVRVFRNLFSSRSYTRTSYQSAYMPGQRQFYDQAFTMLAKLASADGDVSEGVRRRINSFMIYDMHMDGNSYEYARNVFNNALHNDKTFEATCDSFYASFGQNMGMLQTLMDVFYSVCCEDGRMSRNEERLLDYAAKRFQIPQGIIDSIRRKYGIGSKVASQSSYAVLGLEESATEAEIKKAYRKLIMEYHPDKISAKDGVDENFKKYATKRFVEIQQAYEQICSQRNIK